MNNDEHHLGMGKGFSPDGRLPLFPQMSFSVPFRYGMRCRDDLDAEIAVRDTRSQFLPPVFAAAPPVLLVDSEGRQELLNKDTVKSHVVPPLSSSHQAYCVMEIPVSSWHSREVQFLRFYYRHIEQVRLGLDPGDGDEPAWKTAIREILGSNWLYRYLCRQVAADTDLTNTMLSRLLWHEISPRTIANYKTELRKRGIIAGKTEPKPTLPAPVVALADYR